MLRQLDAGGDAFPEEKEAQELDVRLKELAALLRESPARARDAAERLLAPDFKGGRLTPAEDLPAGDRSALAVLRTDRLSDDASRNKSAFGDELAALLAEFDAIQVAEFLITSIAVSREPALQARTEVRYDIVGSGKSAWRGERIGRWRIDWKKDAAGAWRATQWTSLGDLHSRAAAPSFTEVTEAALGRNPSFRRQLRRGLDDWLGRLDGVFMAGGMGHHGVSVGDADGDGRDDLYVAQPAGLPNLLFHNNGDGTFSDVSESAGLAVLDSTSQSLFADVDNDGDQDLILVTRSGLLLFLNDGKGHFSKAPDAFSFKAGLKGAPTSVAMADYDRDGFLDLYVCTYAYFIGSSEEKGGQPKPYHDAQNGPPDALLRNDGHGHFVEVTDDVGLGEHNDRFSFAAAWADYDEDGWPDLLVANDFGRKNLFHNDGLKNGKLHFTDVAATAGVEDYGAGMSATWLDYDNDGHLDIYTGNMWTAAGQRITNEPGFKPDAPQAIRDLYRHHARGNSLFRNRGDGTFEDVSLAAHAEMGRWAWSSDAIDFDNDGWEDLYVVNGMFTRGPGEQDVDLDSFFWRQVTAQSPLTAVAGTPYDDGWRVTNRLLMANGSQARHERNVMLHNNGRGGFDEVSGSVGLDLDQDGRSFAVFDYDGDGKPDLVLLAARSAPQLRLFRNELPSANASLAVRLRGSKSNRDAVGARVIVESDQLRRTKLVTAGSGFISQHSKELLFGLGKSQRIVKLMVQWPSGLTQTFTDVPLRRRVRIEEGNDTPVVEALAPGAAAAAQATEAGLAPPEEESLGTWLQRPFPAPDFVLHDLQGQERSLAGLRGHPAVLWLFSPSAPGSRGGLEELGRAQQGFATAGAKLLAVAVDETRDEGKARGAAGTPGFPVALASEEMAGTYAVLNRYLFDRRFDLELPTAFLLDARGEVVKVYRDPISASELVADLPKIEAAPGERLRRAVPFAGAFQTPPAERNYFQYSLELAEQGFETAALAGFQRAAKLDPNAITFYNLGTLRMKNGQPLEAKAALEQALRLDADYAEASNSLGALLAQSGDVPGAVARFRAALKKKPDYADALNNLGYALFQMGQEQEAYDLYQKALQLQPDFPEAFNNLGIFFGQRGDLQRAESYFRQAVDKRADYGEAANNLALVLMARDDVADAVVLLQRLIEKNPGFEMSYVTLCRIYLETGRPKEGVQVLERLLQRNPKHPLGLQLLQQIRAGG
jgi:Tfp pilus assembly protein PilF/peroxiredoxin